MVATKSGTGPLPFLNEDHPRVDQGEDMALLFAAAQDAARQRGKLDDGIMASLEHSRISPTSFTLATSTGKTIDRVSLAKVREMMGLRQEVVRQLMRGTKLEFTPYANDLANRRNFRSLPEGTRALAWAISHDECIPSKGYTRRDIWIGIALLLVGIVPGVLVLASISRLRHRYKEDLLVLVRRWRTAGRQDPAAHLFAHFHMD